MSEKRRINERSGRLRHGSLAEQGGDALRAAARGDRIGQARPGDALAAARQQFRQGQDKHKRPRLLRHGGRRGLVKHGRGGVGPQPDRVGGFPFEVAHIGVVVAGGTAPVYARHRLALDIGPELPEILADAALAPAMPAADHRGDDAAGLDQKVGDERCPEPGAGERVARRDRRRRLADPRHQIPFTSRATVSRTFMPSARAAKVSAIRCWSTGSASAFTSSIDGARRPS